MNRGQLRTQVRLILQEPAETTNSLWTDSEINDYLNEAAEVICADVQPIQAVELLTSTAGVQEYLLPDTVKEVFAVSYLSGNNLIPLNPTNPHYATEDTPYRGIPDLYYTRAYTRKTANRATDGTMDLDDVTATANEHRIVLGLVPAPSATGAQIVAQTYSKHYTMSSDSDNPIIPIESQRAIIAYAVAMAKQKEQAYAEITTVYMPMFKDFKDQLKKKMIDRGVQARGRHKVYVPGEVPRGSYASDMVQLPWSSS